MNDAEKGLRTFHSEGDTLHVPLRLDELTGRYFLDCPDLEENPVYTKSGYPWVSVVQDSCPYHQGKSRDSGGYTDCGTCRFFKGERPGDIIGVCLCGPMRKTVIPTSENKEENS